MGFVIIYNELYEYEYPYIMYDRVTDVLPEWAYHKHEIVANVKAKYKWMRAVQETERYEKMRMEYDNESSSRHETEW